ncbi:MAG TPA: class I SAM-dependent methyltransferase [Acidimicrobiales bacterium]|nr:class I SAM-dependent methyltransferase [Acidimicrobiales bacterium]
MRVPDQAATGFAAAATAYQQGRPTYPEALLAEISAERPLGPSSRLVDVGAGTGKFSALLAETGAEVLAVEPVASMIRELAAAHPRVHAINGEAHGLPFTASSVDLISAATAFHWFADDEAIAEFARVLKPGGLFALVSNRRDTDDPLGAALEDVLTKRRPVDLSRQSSADHLFARSALFTLARRADVPHVHQLLPEEVLALALSMSYIAPTAAVREEVTAEVRAFLPDEGPVAIGYHALVTLYRRLA